MPDRRREEQRKTEAETEEGPPRYTAATRYAELAVTTNFSFLRGGSHPDEFVAQAALLDLDGVGVADRNTLAGVVRAYSALREWGRLEKERAEMASRSDPSSVKPPLFSKLRFLVGCRLVFMDGAPDIIAYPVDRAAYGRLARLLTIGNRRALKGECHLSISDLLAHAAGLQLIIMEDSTSDHEAKNSDSHADRRAAAHKPRDQSPFPARGNLSGDASGRNQVDSSSTNILPFIRPEMKERSDSKNSGLNDMRSLAKRLGSAGASVWLGITALYGASRQKRFRERVALGQALNIPLIAVNDVLYHRHDRRALQDVLTCVRHGATLDQIGRRLEANAERHLKHGDEMARLFREAPEAVAETIRFVERIGFSLDQLRYEYPEERRDGFSDAQSALEHFVETGAKRRYPDGVPDKVRKALVDEFSLIREKNYASYFLTVHRIVEHARDEGILCQGRGSAANSSICYCLGITEIDPAKNQLLFARFLSAERNEPPDIDVDFEHSRREEVMQYIYKEYRLDHVGIAASVIRYRTRSALRDVGKAFGLSEDAVSALSGAVGGWWDKEIPTEELKRIGLDPDDSRLSQTLKLAGELHGFPRHLSQHTGGFVIARSRLDEIVPIQKAAMKDRYVVEWDKNDLEALRMMKVDCLALGMLTCLKGCFDLLDQHYADPENKTINDIASIPQDDEAVYRMIRRADTLGVFQIESRAQMSMLPRLKPKVFYDLVIEVAIVRPGPIQGDMVHPYLRRRENKEPVKYPSKELKEVLVRTLGVPLFQEQAMQIAIVGAGFTAAEADQLRRAMATFKRVGTIKSLSDKFISGMIENGYKRDFAESCFRQIQGFGEYGFPESHAASFALLVYASSWFKCFYPDIFACALLNAQPMGFYAPAQIIRDLRDHGVEVREIDINKSGWDHTLEGDKERSFYSADRIHALHVDMKRDIRSRCALRVGFRQIKSLSETDAGKLIAARGAGYDSVRDLWLRAELSREALERLADADAFRSIGLDRRQALWAVKALRRSGDKEDLPLLALISATDMEPDAHLPPMPLGAHVVEDYRHLGLSLKAHPVSFVRRRLERRNISPCEATRSSPSGRGMTVAGLVLVRQRPGSAKGVIFMTLEDETGIANIIVWPPVFERYRPAVLGARLVAVRGRLQNVSDVAHIIAEHIEDLSPFADAIAESAGALEPPYARADEVKHPVESGSRSGHSGRWREGAISLGVEPPEQAADLVERMKTGVVRQALPKGRNFH
ncbi:MAG: error-prone DNA polymerase [Rhizobiales bacterium 65-9]|nr:error-prone DNA polymerase [Hyphomicrobiales bacterium]OJY36570.1 MAG: error-prone DNA polymerase [Rhizobiales bacterium 65-9]